MSSTTAEKKTSSTASQKKAKSQTTQNKTVSSKASNETSISNNKESVTFNDVDLLKEQIKELQSQLLAMTEEKKQVNYNYGERMIEFISLVSGSLLLKGSNKRPYEIEGRYQSRSFTETEAKIIVANMGGFMREGFVYINDAEFVKQAGLSDAYNNILNVDQLKELLNQTPQAIINAYKMVADGQKKIIIDMIYEAKTKGKIVDANVLMELSKLSGKDLINIEVDEE